MLRAATAVLILVHLAAGCDEGGGGDASPEMTCAGGKCDAAGDAYDLQGAYDWMLGCSSKTRTVIRYGHEDPWRYHSEQFVEDIDTPESSSEAVWAQHRCLAEMAMHSDLEPYLDATGGYPSARLVGDKLYYDRQVCDLAVSTHTEAIRDALRTECWNRSDMHRRSAIFATLGLVDAEPLGARYYPECYAAFDEDDADESSLAVLECVREHNEAVFERTRGTLELEGLDANEVRRCIDFEPNRWWVEHRCRGLLERADVEVEPSRVRMCQAEIESTVVPLFSSMRSFSQPSGAWTCGRG